ncbi:DUF6491 family protein [Gallaecimonas kandeliae]|uniref:DUF6491 family protein n=1 Tax=Gallaecimonas kandeliae TaxID=3029055 RepID=UPI002648F87E|nr:DUF6491 family protein [Gallaecimonas kandeliae]WKE66369.1 DUF6491 family protein [Gallaecimonas kandeliae]
MRILSLGLTLLLAACASQGDKATIDWQHYAQADTLDIFSPSFSHFEVVNPDQVVLWQSPNRAVLVTVIGACFFNDSSPVLRFTSGMSQVRRDHDAILYDNQRCPISRIQPLDIRKMKKDGVLK